MIEDIRVINFYKDVDGERMWRHEIQIKKNGEWMPIEVLEREDTTDILLPTSEIDWSN